MSKKTIPMGWNEKTTDPRPPPGPSAVEIQQEYYEAVGGVDWKLYEKSERKYLLQNIAVALYGPPTKEGNLGLDPEETKKDDHDKLKKGRDEMMNEKDKSAKPKDGLRPQGYELRDEEGIMKVFNKICEQAKYSHNNENIYINIIRIVCVVPKTEVPFYKLTPDDYWVNLHDKNGDHVHTYVFHVFCIRQCVPISSEGKGCRIYIDHDARVYKDWNTYLADNKLPKSVMVVPENGVYKGSFDDVELAKVQLEDIMPRVKLSVVPSPALGVGATVLRVTDTISTVANVGALVGVVGALAAPAIAPVAIGTAIGVGVVTGTYGIARAAANLVDRSLHEQSIGLENSESRADWINILVSTLGISCSAAGKLLSWAAASGTNVKILMNAVQILQYTNLASGAVGVVNNLGEMIHKYHKYNETPTTLEVFQFTTSVLFLGIGVMSNQTAQEIVQDAQANKINEIRDSLSSNNKRKMFDKVTAETRRVRGTVTGNAEVISALNKIENKDEFFGTLRGINKQLNKNKLRISLSADGNPLINNQHNIGVADLQSLGKSGRQQLFSKYGPAKVNSKNAPTRIYASTSVNTTGCQQKSVCSIRPEEIIKITNFVMSLSKFDEECIAEFLSDMSAVVHDAFLLICAELVSSLVPADIDLLLGLNSHYKVNIVLFIFDYLKSKISVDESDTNISFANVLKKYLRDGRIPKETILQIKRALLDRVAQNKKLFDDPKMFDLMHEYDKRYNTKFLTLHPGEVLKIGKHDILVKSSTTEKLSEWFEVFAYSQKQCEVLLNLCFEVISSLTAKDIIILNDINLDDDVIKIVSYYLIFETEGVLDFLIEDFVGTEFISDIASNLRENIMTWRKNMKLRKHETCNICRGRRYKD